MTIPTGWGADPDGATPLGDDDMHGLKLSWVTDRRDLNEAEADNIRTAIITWERRRHRLEILLDDRTVRDLHRDMFGAVWQWAGTYRLREVNIGVAPSMVAVEVRNLVADAAYWFAPESTMAILESAARFHHRLVQIHPFPNGNGRLARELTDLILISRGDLPFVWGRDDLDVAGETRGRYIAALRRADAGDLEPLRAFLRR